MAHKTVTAYQSAAIFLSSVIAAAATFAISVIAAYFLSQSEFRQFQSAFWPLVFGIYGITGAIQQETTRAVGASLLQNPESRTHTNRLSYSAVAALLGLGIAAIVVMTSPLWSSAFPSYPQMSVVLIAFGVVMYAVYAAVSGASAGRDSWYFYAALGSGEALIRLAATLAAVMLSWHLLGFETAVVVASLIWLPCVVFSRTGRRVWHASIDVSSRRYARNIVMLMLSSAGASILMTAFPFFLQFTTQDQSAQFNALVAAIGVTRSPIMMPLQAFQGVAISAFLKHQDHPLRALARPCLWVLGIGVFGALLAYLIGPFLFDIFYSKYAGLAPGMMLAILTLESAIIALLVLAGNLAIALNMHRLYVSGWVCAAALALLLLHMPLDVVSRTELALGAAPLFGFTVILVGILRGSEVESRKSTDKSGLFQDAPAARHERP